MKNSVVISVILFLLMFVPITHAQDIPLPPLTAENAAQIEQLAILGDGVLTGSLAYSPDGKTLALSGSLGIWLYDPSNFDVQPRFINLGIAVWQVAFSVDGRYLAYQTDSGVTVTDVASGETVFFIENGGRFALHPDNQQIAVALPQNTESSFQDIVQIWSIETTEPLAELSLQDPDVPHRWSEVQALSFSEDGAFFSVSLLRYQDESCGQQELETLIWSNDGQPSSWSILWTLGFTQHTIFHPTQKNFLVMEHDYEFGFSGQALIYSLTDLTQWSITTGEENWDINHLNRDFAAIDIRFDGGEFAIATNGRLWIGEGQTLQHLRSLAIAPDIQAIAYSPRGDTLSAINHDTLWVWSDDGSLKTTVEVAGQLDYERGKTDKWPDIGVLANGLLYTTSRGAGDSFGETIVFSDIFTLEERGRISYGIAVNSAASGKVFSPDGRRLITFNANNSRCGGAGSFNLWDVENQTALNSGFPSGITAFSPDSSLFAQAQYSMIQVYDAQTGEALAMLSGHSAVIEQLEFSSDGKQLISISPADGTIRVWGIPAK